MDSFIRNKSFVCENECTDNDTGNDVKAVKGIQSNLITFPNYQEAFWLAGELGYSEAADLIFNLYSSVLNIGKADIQSKFQSSTKKHPAREFKRRHRSFFVEKDLNDVGRDIYGISNTIFGKRKQTKYAAHTVGLGLAKNNILAQIEELRLAVQRKNGLEINIPLVQSCIIPKLYLILKREYIKAPLNYIPEFIKSSLLTIPTRADICCLNRKLSESFCVDFLSKYYSTILTIGNKELCSKFTFLRKGQDQRERKFQRLKGKEVMSRPFFTEDDLIENIKDYYGDLTMQIPQNRPSRYVGFAFSKEDSLIPPEVIERIRTATQKKRHLKEKLSDCKKRKKKINVSCTSNNKTAIEISSDAKKLEANITNIQRIKRKTRSKILSLNMLCFTEKKRYLNLKHDLKQIHLFEAVQGLPKVLKDFLETSLSISELERGDGRLTTDPHLESHFGTAFCLVNFWRNKCVYSNMLEVGVKPEILNKNCANSYNSKPRYCYHKKESCLSSPFNNEFEGNISNVSSKISFCHDLESLGDSKDFDPTHDDFEIPNPCLPIESKSEVECDLKYPLETFPKSDNLSKPTCIQATVSQEESNFVTKSGRRVKSRFSNEQMKEIVASEMDNDDDSWGNDPSYTKNKAAHKFDNLVIRPMGCGKKCRLCNKVLASDSKFHMIDEHGHEYAKLCPLCTKTDIEDINAHFHGHFGLRPITCTKCNWILYGVKAYDKHLIKCGIKKHFCKQCKKWCKTQEDLDNHVCKRRTKKQPKTSVVFPCDICNTLLSAPGKGSIKRKLRAHKLEVHFPESRTFQCTICPKTFSTEHKLARHLAHHSEYRPFICNFPGCDKRFKTTMNLFQHKCFHDPKLICQNCGLKFPNRQILTKHLTKCQSSDTNVQQSEDQNKVME